MERERQQRILLNKTIDDILSNAQRERTSGTGIEIYNKDGGLEQVENDFGDLVIPSSTKDIPVGKIRKNFRWKNNKCKK